jgi:hypothetical protein
VPLNTRVQKRRAKEKEEILTASTAAYLDVPDEVVALLGAELVPEGEGALLAVVLEPLQQLLRRRRAPPPRRRRRRPRGHHHLRHLSARSSSNTANRERERERERESTRPAAGQ